MATTASQNGVCPTFSSNNLSLLLMRLSYPIYLLPAGQSCAERLVSWLRGTERLAEPHGTVCLLCGCWGLHLYNRPFVYKMILQTAGYKCGITGMM